MDFGAGNPEPIYEKLSLVATGRLIYSRAMSMISPLQTVMLAVAEAHAANEYFIIEGAGNTYGMAGMEKSIATAIYEYAGLNEEE